MEKPFISSLSDHFNNQGKPDQWISPTQGLRNTSDPVHLKLVLPFKDRIMRLHLKVLVRLEHLGCDPREGYLCEIKD
jgi:hypothetical protein